MGMTSSPVARRRGVASRSPALLRALLVACVALPIGCASLAPLDYTPDLASNELFYADVPFRTKAPGDRVAFVAPVADARDLSLLPSNDRGFPIRYGGDEFWVRPVPDMFADVLVRQLEDSELFPSVVADQAAADGLVVQPELLAFTVGAKEGMSGSQTFAEVGLRLRVYGPEDGAGERPLWHDEVYGNRQVSEFEIKPISPYRLIGRALQVTMSKALGGIDGSNVARSSVPVEAVEPRSPSGTPTAASATLR